MPSRLSAKTCLIIGNGPSLAGVPNEFLAKYPTFGSNRVYLKYTPFIYACVNLLVIEQYHTEMAQMNCIKYIRDSHKHLVPGSTGLRKRNTAAFSKEPLNWIYEGWTVTFVLMQLAYWYGFQRVGLVGVDHSYSFDGKPNKKLTAQGADPNHFDPSYFSEGKAWNAPDLVRSEQSYLMAKEAYEAAGRKIINLTAGSQLDVFEREDWGAW
jgi:hypothetical protein